jgi:two-component system alkaline phosphatase synthesis response regulator PhoP
MKKLLVIEDDPTSAKIITSTLCNLGEIEVADLLKTGKTAFDQKKHDLILLDLNLPDGTGFELLQELSRITTMNTPIIILSCNKRETTKVQAFDLGAYDYIQKPYPLLETRARVQRVLKAQNVKALDYLLAMGPITLNIQSHVVEVKSDLGVLSEELTAKEFKILKALMERPNTVLDRRKILDLVWGPDVHLTDRTIDTHLAAVRKKLGKAGEMIRSIRGVGYEFGLA